MKSIVGIPNQRQSKGLRLTYPPANRSFRVDRQAQTIILHSSLRFWISTKTLQPIGRFMPVMVLSAAHIGRNGGQTQSVETGGAIQ
jgi:hypothetical protein